MISERVYERRLPGGGFVAIEVARHRSVSHPRFYTAKLLVERRVLPRASSGAPPVIAYGSGDSLDAIYAQLLPTAESNCQIGAALLRQHPVVL